jgi:hypothetical protein
MKTKRLSRKLELNKKTIANLSNEALNAVKGGRTTATCPGVCITNEPRCTAAGCITEVELSCFTVNDTEYPCTITMCTFYCDTECDCR